MCCINEYLVYILHPSHARGKKSKSRPDRNPHFYPKRSTHHTHIKKNVFHLCHREHGRLLREQGALLVLAPRRRLDELFFHNALRPSYESALFSTERSRRFKCFREKNFPAMSQVAIFWIKCLFPPFSSNVSVLFPVSKSHPPLE